MKTILFRLSNLSSSSNVVINSDKSDLNYLVKIVKNNTPLYFIKDQSTLIEGEMKKV